MFIEIRKRFFNAMTLVEFNKNRQKKDFHFHHPKIIPVLKMLLLLRHQFDGVDTRNCDLKFFYSLEKCAVMDMLALVHTLCHPKNPIDILFLHFQKYLIKIYNSVTKAFLFSIILYLKISMCYLENKSARHCNCSTVFHLSLGHFHTNHATFRQIKDSNISTETRI